MWCKLVFTIGYYCTTLKAKIGWVSPDFVSLLVTPLKNLKTTWLSLNEVK